MELDADRRQQIIEAAMHVFARDGYHKATIKSIAREGGLRAPALIYHYFDDKRDLFSAVIGHFQPFHDTPLAEPERAGEWLDLPPDVFLPRLLERLLALRENPDSVRMMRLYLSEASRSPDVAEAIGDFQTGALALLERYLQRQVELQRLRPHDSASVARLFVGAALAFLLGSEILPAVAATMPPPAAYIRAAVDTMLHGLAVDVSPQESIS